MEIVIFTDRDGDQLTVVPKDPEGGERAVIDPVITIIKTAGGLPYSRQSVIFDEDEAPAIIVGIVQALNLSPDQLQQIMNGVFRLILEDM